MNTANRLAEIVSALDRIGIPVLVMGGHAARYYGIERNTVDYDLHVTLDNWDDLNEILKQDSFLADCGLIARAGSFPFWSRDGRELFFQPGPSRPLAAVHVTTQPTFVFTQPTDVWRGQYFELLSPFDTNIDITPDGKRFIGPVPAGQLDSRAAAPAQIQVVLNWFEELKQRVSAHMTPERLRQVEELYHSAREHELSERQAFLSEACRGDEELRARWSRCWRRMT